MIYLTKSALKYAVNICEKIPYYRVGIVVSDMSIVKDIVNIIDIDIGDNGAKFKIAKSNILITFTNKSTIEIFSSNISHGKRTNLLVADDKIDKEALRSIFIPYETLGVPYIGS